MAVAGKIGDLIATVRDEKLHKALEYLRDLPANYLARRKTGYVSRIEIEGDDIFAIHQVYETKPENTARYEAHKKYIDLQFLLSGDERIYLAPEEGASIETPYDEEKDIAFYKPVKRRELLLRAGMVAIFEPRDLHAPGISPPSGPSTVRKTVVKVRV